MEKATCSTCGLEIIWAISPAGARLPLDARPVTVYRLDEGDPPAAVRATILTANGKVNRIAPQPKVYLSHFATCPNAAQHSRGRTS